MISLSTRQTNIRNYVMNVRVRRKAKIDIGLLDNLDASDLTRKHYKEVAGYFLKFVSDNNYRFDQPVLLWYRSHLNNSNLKPNSKRGYFNIARLFCQIIYQLGYTSTDLTKDVLGRTIKGFQAGQHSVYGVNRREVGRLNRYLQELKSSFINDRLKVIVALLLYQGLRQIELHRLNVEDVDFKTGRLAIRGKGRDYKEHIYLHPKTAVLLKTYLQYLPSTGPLIVSSRDRRSRLASPLCIHYIVKARFKKLKINRSVHGFRHYFATKLIEHYKGDLATVSLYTRHKNINTLQIYNDKIINKRDLKKYYLAVDGFH